MFDFVKSELHDLTKEWKKGIEMCVFCPNCKKKHAALATTTQNMKSQDETTILPLIPVQCESGDYECSCCKKEIPDKKCWELILPEPRDGRFLYQYTILDLYQYYSTFIIWRERREKIIKGGKKRKMRKKKVWMRTKRGKLTWQEGRHSGVRYASSPFL